MKVCQRYAADNMIVSQIKIRQNESSIPDDWK